MSGNRIEPAGKRRPDHLVATGMFAALSIAEEGEEECRRGRSGGSQLGLPPTFDRATPETKLAALPRGAVDNRELTIDGVSATLP